MNPIEKALATADKVIAACAAMEEPSTPECLNRYGNAEPDECRGGVEYRMALSGTGRSFPRCDKHWQQRLAEQDRINERYPDSPNPPADFDPAYAGESWDGE